MNVTLAMFPGIAAATPGMGWWAVERGGAAAATLAIFSRASGLSVETLVTTAGDEELYRDRCWEIATVATEVAAMAAYREVGGRIDAALGFSIGAYAALAAAGVVTAEQVVTMIDTVSEASLALEGTFAMVAVTGAPSQLIGEICEAGRVELAAEVTRTQALLAGRREDVAKAIAVLRRESLWVTPLTVRWPLHTSLMAPAATALGAAVQTVGPLRQPQIPVYSPVDGSALQDPESCWQLLVEHLHTPLSLPQTFAAARRGGAGRCVELGPGCTMGRIAQWLHRDDLEVLALP